MAKDPIGVRSLLGYMPEHDCLPLDQTAADVVATFGELSGLPARAARQRASDVLDLVGSTKRASDPSAASPPACASARSWRRPSWPIPSWCCSTSPPPASIRWVGRRCSTWWRASVAFGISVLLATHLLDDVQQVCDHVIMLDGGRLVVSGSTSGLLERTGVLTIDVGPDRAAS